MFEFFSSVDQHFQHEGRAFFAAGHVNDPNVVVSYHLAFCRYLKLFFVATENYPSVVASLC